MFCNNCGNQVADGQNFCMLCGSPVTPAQPQYTQMEYQQPQYTQVTPNQPQYTQQNAYQQPYMQQNTYAAPQLQSKPNMGWFNFIIWVQLFLNAILNTINGFTAIMGKQYVDNYGRDVSDLVYRTYDNLKIYDTIYGMALIMLAVLAIMIRFRLARFKKNSHISYISLLSFNVITPLIYCLVASGETGVSMGDLLEDTRLSMIVVIILIFINVFYFKKRKHLFVN